MSQSSKFSFLLNSYPELFKVRELAEKLIHLAAQGKLALPRIKQFPIYIPPYDEQNEILTTVEALFSNADAIEKQYKILKEKINTLPQSILHKAFKGDLVPQLESDGDARELLEEIKHSAGNLVQRASARNKKMQEFNNKFSGQHLEKQDEINTVAESEPSYNKTKYKCRPQQLLIGIQ